MKRAHFNILILGIAQLNFIRPIVSVVRRSYTSTKLGIKIKNNVSADSYNSVFDAVHKPGNPGLVSLLPLLPGVIFNKFVAKFLWISLFESGLTSAFTYFKSFAKARHFVARVCRTYEVVQVHFVSLKHLYEIPFLSKDSCIILSFWGSDLLRNSSILNGIMVKYSLSRAKVITVQSAELKEVIQIKYGRHLESKIKVIQFILDKSIFEELDKLALNPGSSSYCLAGKVNILVGHNASRDNNHTRILEQFEVLSDEIKKSVNLIFVFSYGITNKEDLKEYRLTLAAACEKLKIKHVFIDQYMDSREVALLRFSCPVVIHMPVSDALSAAITESLYVDAVVVAGAWLPYGPMRRAGLTYLEVEDFDALGTRLGEIITNYQTHRLACVDHKKKITDRFLSDTIMDKWKEVYNG